jgi:hypothetical protein
MPDLRDRGRIPGVVLARFGIHRLGSGDKPRPPLLNVRTDGMRKGQFRKHLKERRCVIPCFPARGSMNGAMKEASSRITSAASRRGQRGTIRAHYEIDLVDLQKLGIDRWNFARASSVIVIDELHGSTKHSSIGICALFPDPLREQGGLAVQRETARQRHAVADLCRRAGLRACGTGKYRCGQHPQRGGVLDATDHGPASACVSWLQRN